MGKPESLRNNFGIWDFNERHNKHIVTLAQKVNNSILQTFQEKQKTFYLLSLSSHVIVISCFQMHFLLDFMWKKNPLI